MAGGHVDALNLRHFADQRQTVSRDRPEAGLPRDDPVRAKER
jgi:hypothetical protein